MYTALYRQYRPTRFGDVLGQSAVVAALQNQVKTGRIGHSYIFTGTRGTGKTTCAKLFARAINCENPQNGEPCGECDICRGLADGSIYDVSEIDAASNNGVDNVRALREETAYVPSVCRYRVYIIDEVHMLSTSAFNALLKVMEEPPPHVVFILATTEIHKVPATILSRCQRFDFSRLSPEVIEGLLKDVAEKAGIVLEDGARDLLARLADGAARDALSLLDTCLGAAGDGPVTEAVVRTVAGVADKSYLFAVSDAVAAQDAAGALTALNGLLSASFEGRRLTEELIYHYRNLLLAGIGGGADDMLEVDAGYFERYKASAAATGRSLCVLAVERLGGALDAIGRGAAARLQLELAVLDLCTPAPRGGRQAPGAPLPAPSPSKVKNIPAVPGQNPPAPIPPAPEKPRVKPLSAPQSSESSPPWETDEPAPQTPVKKAEGEGKEATGEGTGNGPAPDAPVAKAPPAQKAAPSPAPAAENAGPAPDRYGCVPIENWNEVVARLRGNGMLFAYLNGSRAYFWEKKVLIEAGETFIGLVRESKETLDTVRGAIKAVLGVSPAIGPYPPPGAAPKEAEPEIAGFKRLADLGVPVERS